MSLSICIPTFNRAGSLRNCLNAIAIARAAEMDVEVCVSDNASNDETTDVVAEYSQVLRIEYNRNPSNVGFARNLIKSVQLAHSDFVWTIGDDDLMRPNGIALVLSLLEENDDLDFFFVNSGKVSATFVGSYPQPFNSRLLPASPELANTTFFEGRCRFDRLIDPMVSFDFLGGIFNVVARRSCWLDGAQALDSIELSCSRVWGNHTSTFPHVVIYASQFMGKTIYATSRAPVVTLLGVREWSSRWPLVRSIRFAESIDLYRRSGLRLFQYLKCKNHVARTFLPDFRWMRQNPTASGYRTIRNPWGTLVRAAVYPGFYQFLLDKLARAFVKPSGAK